MKHLTNLLLLLAFCFLSACATPGQKYIQLSYTGTPGSPESGSIGITAANDERKNVSKGYIGKRILMDNRQETYLVQEMDLSDSISRIISAYYQKKGLATRSIDPWKTSTQGLSDAPSDLDYVIRADIRQFECNARKKGTATHMILDIDLIIFLGDMNKKVLKTIPVKFSLEKTVFTFTKQKLEGFVNQSIEEILHNALP